MCQQYFNLGLVRHMQECISKEPVSIEQMVRNLLERAIHDRIVSMPRKGTFNDNDHHPQARTSGELVGVGNMLRDYLLATVKDRDDRWQRAVGHDLAQAEEQAASLEAYEKSVKR